MDMVPHHSEGILRQMPHLHVLICNQNILDQQHHKHRTRRPPGAGLAHWKNETQGGFTTIFSRFSYSFKFLCLLGRWHLRLRQHELLQNSAEHWAPNSHLPTSLWPVISLCIYYRCLQRETSPNRAISSMDLWP